MTDKVKFSRRAEKQSGSNFTSIAISKAYYAKVQDLKKKFPVRTSNAAALEAIIDAGLPMIEQHAAVPATGAQVAEQ